MKQSDLWFTTLNKCGHRFVFEERKNRWKWKQLPLMSEIAFVIKLNTCYSLSYTLHKTINKNYIKKADTCVLRCCSVSLWTRKKFLYLYRWVESINFRFQNEQNRHSSEEGATQEIPDKMKHKYIFEKVNLAENYFNFSK